MPNHPNNGEALLPTAWLMRSWMPVTKVSMKSRITLIKKVKTGFDVRLLLIQSLTLLSQFWNEVRLEVSKGSVAIPRSKIAKNRKPPVRSES